MHRGTGSSSLLETMDKLATVFNAMGEVQQNWVKTEAARTRGWLMLRVAGVGVHRWSPQLQASLLSTPLALRPWSLHPLWHWAWCVICFGQWARCDETGSLGKKKMLPCFHFLSPFFETAVRTCPGQPENVPGLANWSDAEACECKRHEEVNPAVLRDQLLASWYPDIWARPAMISRASPLPIVDQRLMREPSRDQKRLANSQTNEQ